MFNDFNHAKICQVPKNPTDGFLWIIAPELDAENDHNVHIGLYTHILHRFLLSSRNNAQLREKCSKFGSWLLPGCTASLHAGGRHLAG